MPGIFGFIDRIGNSVSGKIVIDMENSVKHENCHVEKWISDFCLLGTVQLKFLRNKHSIIHDKEMPLVGISTGNVYNKRELSQKFGIKNAFSQKNCNQFFIDLYKKKGLDFVSYLNGLFNVAIFDKEREKVIIANDRYGFYPLFYSVNSKRLIFASQARSVLNDVNLIPRIDETAIPEFFTFSYLLGDKTFFKGVKMMMPANELIYDKADDHVEVKQYWDFSIPEKETHMPTSLSNLLEEFKKLMKKAVERQVQDKKEIGVFLSGGLDSRILAAFASKTDTNVITFTFGVRNCPEQKIAKQVADRLGLENVFYEIPSDFIAKYAEKIVYLGDGLIRIRDCHFIALLEEIRKKVDTVLLGTFGGELFGSKIARELRNIKGKDEVMNYLFKKKTTVIPIEKHEEVFADAFYSETRGKVRKNFIETFDKIRFGSAADIVDYWEYRNRQRRYIFQSFQYINWYIETRHPFLDNDLVEFFAFRLPFDLRLDERFLQKALDYCFPSLSDIPWEHTGVAPNSHQVEVFLGKAILFAKDKIGMTAKRALKGRVILAPCDYREYEEWLRTGSKAYTLEILLDPRTLKRGYFKFSYIKKILREHMDYRKNHDQLICDLINFELLNRIFLEGH
jgi:asparagine synthase (glutamine-hydrolysing)